MRKSPKLMGRPPKDTSDAMVYEKPVYKMFLDKLPLEFIADGYVNTLKLGEKLPCCRFTIYRWFHGANISRKNALRLAELSKNSTCERKGLLTAAELLTIHDSE